MTKFASFIVLLVLMSCNNANPVTSAVNTDSMAAAGGDSSKKEISYPYPIGYSSQFEFADPEKSRMVLELWKAFDSNSLDNIRDKFADSVMMIFPDMKMHAGRDSIIASTKAYRNSFTSVTSKVDVVMSVRSTDKKGDWVLVWGDETHTNKKNKTDSVALHEVWGLNAAGKIEFMQQYISHK